MESTECHLPDADATVTLARCLAPEIAAGGQIWLHGELGAGKTTFARALLQALGVSERIKSPTYSLVEQYRLPAGNSAWHLDLYRIAAADELEYLGVDPLCEANALVLVEWPERAAAALPPPDLHIDLSHRDVGRLARLQARSPRAMHWLQALRSGEKA